MSNVQVGNEFEDSSLEIIKNALEKGSLGLPKDQVKICTKKKYPCRNPELGEVEFDITIEVWPPNAKSYVQIYVFECKNYNKNLPKDQIQKFTSDLIEVFGFNVKAVIVSANKLGSGAMAFAKSKRILVIQGKGVEDYSILYFKHSQDQNGFLPYLVTKEEQAAIDLSTKELLLTVERSILRALVPNDEEFKFGVKYLSGKEINEIAKGQLKKFNPEYLNEGLKLDAEILKQHLRDHYSICVDGINPNDTTSLGECDILEKKILLNKSIVGTNRELFVLAHEFGHFILHDKVRIQQELLNSFEDSQRNFATGKHDLVNYHNWIEWQANWFAASFVVPDTTLLFKLWRFRQEYNNHQIVYNGTRESQKKLNHIVHRLAEFFNVSKTTIYYRLADLNMIRDVSRTKRLSDVLKEFLDSYYV